MATKTQGVEPKKTEYLVKIEWQDEDHDEPYCDEITVWTTDPEAALQAARDEFWRILDVTVYQKVKE